MVKLRAKDSESIWRENDSRNAHLLVPSSPLEGEHYCRLSFSRESGMLCVVSCPPPVHNDINVGGEGNAEDAGTEQQGWETKVLDEIDPVDIIGAEMEVDFRSTEWTGFLHETTQTGGDDKSIDASRAAKPLEHSIPVANTATVPVRPRRLNRNMAVAYLNIYCYPKQNSSNRFSMKSSVSRQAHHRQFEVAATEDFAFVRSVVRGIRCLANLGHHKSGSKGSGPRPRRYLVVMNPFSGTGQGQRIYDSTVKPMFAQAGIDHDLCVTQHGGHAMDRMASSLGDSRHDSEAECDEQAESRDLSSYDALIAMGGDGMLWELQQGILARHDSEIILKKLSFGIIGCGTCNGLAATLLHWANEKYSPLESTYMICKGQIGPMDLSRYETLSGKIYTGFLTFSWAFIADVDLDSECLRFLGALRTDIWAAYRILRMKAYKGVFSYLPPSAVEDRSKAVTMPPLGEALPQSWETVSGDFILLWASQVSHASYKEHQSPESQMNDGVFRVMVVRSPISRLQMLKLALGIESAGHIHHDRCEMYECMAFRLVPGEEGSHNDLDGEKIEDGPIQACVLPGAANFFFPN